MKKSILSIFALSFVLIVAFFLICGPAEATNIYTDTMTIAAGDPTQLGRINRNGVPSDWSAPKAFPGAINPTSSYHYTTLNLDLASIESPYSSYGAYIQISFDSTTFNTFLSAYLDSYSPLNMATNYLGDPGSSGNSSGVAGDPRVFQIVVPSAHHLVLVLNETTPGGGLGLPGGLLVEAFTDTAYTDLTPKSGVPEPTTMLLLGLGLVGLAGARRKFQK